MSQLVSVLVVIRGYITIPFVPYSLVWDALSHMTKVSTQNDGN